MFIEQRPTRLWNLANRLSRSALVNGALPWNFYPLVNEYPKSGGSWLTQMLGEALDLPNPRRRLPMLKSSMMHGHYLHPMNLRNIVMVWRDGRDIMVSFYFHLVAENNFASPTTKAHSRKLMAVSDVDDVAANLPKFIELVSVGKLHPRFGWGDFYKRWANHPKVLASTRYEAMLEDAGTELHRLQAALGGLKTPAQCAEIAERFSFERQANRKAGVADNSKFLRKGIAGDWKNHFSREAAEVFDHYASEALIALGYENDSGWVDRHVAALDLR